MPRIPLGRRLLLVAAVVVAAGGAASSAQAAGIGGSCENSVVASLGAAGPVATCQLTAFCQGTEPCNFELIVSGTALLAPAGLAAGIFSSSVPHGAACHVNGLVVNTGCFGSNQATLAAGSSATFSCFAYPNSLPGVSIAVRCGAIP